MAVSRRIASTSFGSFPDAKSLEVAAPHAPMLMPVRTTSLPQCPAYSAISATMSSIGRYECRPRAWTVRQNVQKLSHPVWITTVFLVVSAPVIFVRIRESLDLRSSPGTESDTGGSSGRSSIRSRYGDSSAYRSKNRGSVSPFRNVPHPVTYIFSLPRNFLIVPSANFNHRLFAWSVTTQEATSTPSRCPISVSFTHF